MNNPTKDSAEHPNSPPVRLADVLEEMDFQPEGWSAYVNSRTGEVVSAPDDIEEAEMMYGADTDIEELAEAIESSEDFIPLPTSFDVHEWSIMRDFCNEIEDQQQREQLLNALHGSGAFRMFKRDVDRLNLRDAWFRYRDGAIERIAIEFLEAKNIPWTRD